MSRILNEIHRRTRGSKESLLLKIILGNGLSITGNIVKDMVDDGLIEVQQEDGQHFIIETDQIVGIGIPKGCSSSQNIVIDHGPMEAI